MKKIKFIFSLFLTLLCVACGTKTETPTEAPQPEVLEETVETGPKASRPWNYSQNLTFGGKQFEISLERKADSTLQMVKDAEGADYLDNRIRLCIAVDGAEKMNRSFTKHSFESYMAAADVPRCMLHGIAFDEERDGVLVFGAQVGNPDEDVNYYFVVKVDKDGGIVISRDYQPDTAPVH